MDDTENDKSAKHWKRVQTILICLVDRDATLESLSVFYETEDNSYLHKSLVCKLETLIKDFSTDCDEDEDRIYGTQ